MTKKSLRHLVLDQLKNQDPLEKQRRDDLLCQDLLATEAYQKADVIATYLAMPHEFDTSFLINQALKDHKRVLIPKTYGQGKMIFTDYHPDQLVTSHFGLLEPTSDVAMPMSTIDLIHVPGVVFDADGYRIGYGGGYYDRYLSSYEGSTISTTYAFQHRDFDHDDFDIPVKEVLTR